MGRHAAETLAREGRVWIRGAVPEGELGEIAAAVEGSGRLDLHGPLGALLRDGAAGRAVRRLRSGMAPVRAVAFEKNERNWRLPWHQDRVIRVAERDDAAPVANWSRKGSVWHCEPDGDVLRAMLFARIHLDRCDAGAGGMEMALGSHARGPVPAADAARVAREHPREVEEAAPGDVLILSMFTLHRSRPASRPAARRRVLRVDYAAGPPPAPLRWDV